MLWADLFAGPTFLHQIVPSQICSELECLSLVLLDLLRLSPIHELGVVIVVVI